MFPLLNFSFQERTHSPFLSQKQKKYSSIENKRQQKSAPESIFPTLFPRIQPKEIPFLVRPSAPPTLRNIRNFPLPKLPSNGRRSPTNRLTPPPINKNSPTKSASLNPRRKERRSKATIIKSAQRRHCDPPPLTAASKLCWTTSSANPTPPTKPPGNNRKRIRLPSDSLRQSQMLCCIISTNTKNLFPTEHHPARPTTKERSKSYTPHSRRLLWREESSPIKLVVSTAVASRFR